MILNNFKKSKLVLFIFVIIIALNSGHAFQSIYNMYATYSLFCFSVVLAGCWIILAISKRITLSLSELLCFLFFIFIILTILSDYNYNHSYTFLLSTIFVAYFTTKAFNFECFVSVYLKLMTFVSAVAVVCFFLYNYTPLLNWLPLVETKTHEYAIGIIFNVLTKVPERNCAMFWEPGLFATALTIAMVFEIIFKKKPVNKFRIILFIIGFITSTSSAGYVLCILCLLLLATRKILPRGKIKLSYFLWLIPVACVVWAFLNMDYIISNTPLGKIEYFEKLLSENLMGSSRVAAIEHNLKIFLEYPIFGGGFTVVNTQMERVADTSTSTYLMSLFGLMGVLYNVVWIFGIFRIKSISFITKILLLLIVFLTLNKEPHHMFVVTWCLMFYMFAPKTKDKIPNASQGGKILSTV